MNDYKIEDYLFTGLCKSRTTSLAYLVGLVNSPAHKIGEPDVAKPILSWLYEVEEQCTNAEQLRESQNSFFGRFFADEYFPQTPVMLTDRWSPIGSILEHGFPPISLKRSSGASALATGIWDSVANGLPKVQRYKTDEELFWGIFARVSQRAVEREMLVSVIAQPGWTYEDSENLAEWSSEEITKADRVVWHRVPKGIW